MNVFSFFSLTRAFGPNRSTVRDAKEMQLFIKNLQQNKGLHARLMCFNLNLSPLTFPISYMFFPIIFHIEQLWCVTIFNNIFLSQTLPGNKFQQNTWHPGASISIAFNGPVDPFLDHYGLTWPEWIGNYMDIH